MQFSEWLPVSHKTSYVSGKCTKLNHYRASRWAVRICDHAVTNYRKKNFRIQKSDKTAGFGSKTARNRIRQIWNFKVPIPSHILNENASRAYVSLCYTRNTETDATDGRFHHLLNASVRKSKMHIRGVPEVAHYIFVFFYGINGSTWRWHR